MTIDYAGSILNSLRRIIRSIDKHNKQLSNSRKLTVPQLVCLRQLLLEGPQTNGDLSKGVFLSKASLTGIIDRLEAKGLVCRQRCPNDRRRVEVSLTPEGEQMAKSMPWPLQERFMQGLSSLSEEEICMVDKTLKNLLDMMEAPEITVWPFGGEDVSPPPEEIADPVTKSEPKEDE